MPSDIPLWRVSLPAPPRIVSVPKPPSMSSPAPVEQIFSFAADKAVGGRVSSDDILEFTPGYVFYVFDTIRCTEPVGNAREALPIQILQVRVDTS